VNGALDRVEQCHPGITLVAGSLASSADESGSDVWLLVDGRPFPARFTGSGKQFVGTIPTSEMPDGVYHVTAYIVDRASGVNQRIGDPLTLRADPPAKRRLVWVAPPPPPECGDPFGLLQGT
jgi:hypothetical protein